MVKTLPRHHGWLPSRWSSGTALGLSCTMPGGRRLGGGQRRQISGPRHALFLAASRLPSILPHRRRRQAAPDGLPTSSAPAAANPAAPVPSGALRQLPGALCLPPLPRVSLPRTHQAAGRVGGRRAASTGSERRAPAAPSPPFGAGMVDLRSMAFQGTILALENNAFKVREVGPLAHACRGPTQAAPSRSGCLHSHHCIPCCAGGGFICWDGA